MRFFAVYALSAAHSCVSMISTEVSKNDEKLIDTILIGEDVTVRPATTKKKSEKHTLNLQFANPSTMTISVDVLEH